jgi:hypothetical protein
MADVITPNLSLTKPEVGASKDTWGGKLNGNFDILDDIVGDVQETTRYAYPDKSTAGTAPNYTLTITNFPDPIPDGTVVGFVAHETNTGSANLQINFSANLPIRITGTDTSPPLRTFNIVAGAFYQVAYDDTNSCWLLLNPTPLRTIPTPFDIQQSVNDGVTSASSALSLFLSFGGRVRIPAGTYLITTTIDILINKSLYVECDPQAEFVAATGLEGDMIRFTALNNDPGFPSEGVDIIWSGGSFDQSGQRNSTSEPQDSNYPPPFPGTAATGEGLSFRGDGQDPTRSGFRIVVVERARFSAGTHWEIAGGDSAVFIGPGARAVSVRDCYFRGYRDLAIYVSRNDGGFGRFSSDISNNYLENCYFGIGVKRGVSRFTISNNFIVNTVIGILVDYVQAATFGGAIERNTMLLTKIGIRISDCQSVTIQSNRFATSGAVDNSDNAVVTYNFINILLQGAINCFINDNASSGTNSAYAGQDLVGIALANGNINPSSIRNFITNFSGLNGVHTVAFEVDGEARSNYYEHVYAFNGVVRNPFIPSSSDSTVVDTDDTYQNTYPQLIVKDGTPSDVSVRRAATGNGDTGLNFSTGTVSIYNNGVQMFSGQQTLIEIGEDWASFTPQACKLNGKIIFTPPASTNPTNNGDLIIEATNNSTITFKYRGSDGTIRSGTLSLI